MARRKSEGAIHGNPNIKQVQASGAKGMRRKADDLVRKIVNILRDVPDQSKLTHKQVAERLNSHGVRTGHGETWNKSRVRNPLGRAREVLDAEDKADRLRMEEDEDFGLF